MKLTTIFENNKEKELEFLFQEDEANEIILSFLQKNNLINNKDKSKVFYFNSFENANLTKFVIVEEYIEERVVNNIISTIINKIEFKLEDNKKTELYTIFTDYISNNFKYVFFNTSNSSYSTEYEVDYEVKYSPNTLEHNSVVTFKKTSSINL